MENTENHKHVHFGHLGIISLSAALLLSIFVMKNGFHFSQDAKASKPQLTYEQVKSQVEAHSNIALQQTQDNTASQLAALDPNFNNGAVLGTSTSADLNMQDMGVPKAETMVTKEMLGAIHIKTIDATDSDAVKKYSELVLYVESKNNALSLLASINSEDHSTLATADSTTKKIVQELAQIPVPKSLTDYHKIKMMYYTTLGEMAQVFEGKKPDDNIQNLTTILFSLTDKLDRDQAQFEIAY